MVNGWTLGWKQLSRAGRCLPAPRAWLAEAQPCTLALFRARSHGCGSGPAEQIASWFLPPCPARICSCDPSCLPGTARTGRGVVSPGTCRAVAACMMAVIHSLVQKPQRAAGFTALMQTYFSVLFFKQNKMEDRLDEAIHVLRNHAVGQTAAMPSNHGDMHGLLGSAPAHSATVGSLGQAFPASVMSLGNRHPSLVSAGASRQLVGMHPRHGVPGHPEGHCLWAEDSSAWSSWGRPLAALKGRRAQKRSGLL